MVTTLSLQASQLFDIALPTGFNQALLLLLCFFVLVFKRGHPLLPRKYGWLIVAMAIYLSAAWRVADSQWKSYLVGSGMTFTFVAAFVAGYNVRINIRNLVKTYRYLLAFLGVLAVVTGISAVAGHVSVRETETLVREPGALGAYMNIAVLLSIALYLTTRRFQYIMLSFLFSIAVIATTLKKSIIMMVLVWGVFIAMERSKGKAATWTIGLLIALCAGWLIVGDSLMANVKESASVYQASSPEEIGRPAMYLAAIQITKDRFPFGSGMGTFGSPASVLFGYSETYVKYGLDNVYGLMPSNIEDGWSLFEDAYWAHIIGELGAVGTLIMLLIWLYPAAGAVRYLKRECSPEQRGCGFFIVSIVVVMTGENFAHYSMEIAAFIVIHSAIVGMTYCYLSSVPPSRSLYRRSSLSHGYKPANIPQID
jgi:hypothetical protein